MIKKDRKRGRTGIKEVQEGGEEETMYLKRNEGSRKKGDKEAKEMKRRDRSKQEREKDERNK